MYEGPLFIASDHGGFQLKKRLVRFIENELHLTITDLGPEIHDPTDDFPDYASALAKKVVSSGGRGILLCKSGIGVCVVANKMHGIRAGLGYNITVAESMIHDDNTNILCLAGGILSEEFAMAITRKWLETAYEKNERFERRLEKIADLDASYN